MRYTVGMDPNLEAKLTALKEELDVIYVSVERTRKYLLWTLVVTLVLFVLPLLGLMFAIPSFIGSYTEALSGLEGY